MGMLVIVGWLRSSFDLFLGLGFLNFGKKFKSFCLRLDLDCTQLSRNLLMFASLPCLCELVAQDRHGPGTDDHK